MPANNADFHDGSGEIKYRYTPGHPSQHQMGAYAKVLTDLGNGVILPLTTRIGEMSWSKKTGVAKIAIHPDFQRQGVGSTLWAKATEYANRFNYVAPSASASTTRTDAGDAFLKSVDPNAGERKKRAADDFGDYYK